MFQSTVKSKNNVTTYELLDSTAESALRVVPERGGIITGLKLRGEELLFLNEATLYDKQANIRGGIPILFPICGQLANGEYEWDHQSYSLKNHGFARNCPWNVLEVRTDDALSISLGLKSNEETKRLFPFAFEVHFRYELQGDSLVIHQEYWNHSLFVMPMYGGFHPYFQSSSKYIRIQSDAKQYIDYNDLKVKAYEGAFDLENQPESFVLFGMQTPQVEFALPEAKRTVRLEFDQEFRYLVVWSEKDSPFLCVEPWMALPNEMNEKKELIYVQPGDCLQTSIKISVVDPE